MGGTPSRSAAMMKGSGTTGGQKQSIPLEDALIILLQGFLKGKRYSQTHKSFPLKLDVSKLKNREVMLSLIFRCRIDYGINRK